VDRRKFLIPPPYSGQAGRGSWRKRVRLVSSSTRDVVARPAQPALSRPASFAPRTSRGKPARKVEEVPVPEPVATLLLDEARDVPYQFPRTEVSALSNDKFFAGVGPRERIVLPGGWSAVLKGAADDFRRGWQQLHRSLVGRSPVLNVATLLVGCLVLVGILASLTGVQSSLLSLASVQDKAQGAYKKLVAAQAALAESDFESSDQYFSDAEVLLKQAQEEMDQALLSSQELLTYLDVTGTVRSSTELLLAGQNLTQAGQHLSRGVRALMPTSSDGKPKSLLLGVTAATEEFTVADAKLSAVQDSLAQVSSPLLPDDVTPVGRNSWLFWKSNRYCRSRLAPRIVNQASP